MRASIQTLLRRNEVVVTTDKELSDLLLSGQFKVEQREGEDYSAALLRTALEECKRKIELEDKVLALSERLDRIQRWCEAYPVDVFPEPNMEEVRRLLGDGLLSRLSARISRHVLNGIQKIAEGQP